MGVLLILLIPLFGAVMAYALGRKNAAIAGWIASFSALAAFIMTILTALPILNDSAVKVVYEGYEWFSAGALSVDFALQLDALSALMCLIITGVGSLIHFYSIGYMAEDDSRPRFFAYLNLFLFFMLLLVLAENLVVLFAGWEGVGLCSYLLIGFWFKNPQYAKAGQKAFILNRIGDAGFLVGIFSLYKAFGVLDFNDLNAALSVNAGSQSFWLTLAGLGLFLGATGKSAQIPLFVWLPDAMAGPTPVSALIHAATMVTAGIYLLARLALLYAGLAFVQELIFSVAFITAAMAGLIALAQNDLKKILAYSTVSQLGFMFMAAASGAYAVALFHVTTHAFFKACLFLSAGNIIHALHGEQDIRKMGGLFKKLPATALSYLICLLAISGVYPLAGYFSKHSIMLAAEKVYLAEYGFLLTALALLTAVYMARSFVLVFLGHSRFPESVHIHKPAALMQIPVIILAILSAIAGLLLEGHLEEFLVPVVGTFSIEHHSDFLSSVINSLLPLIAIVLICGLYLKGEKALAFLNHSFSIPKSILINKFYVDEAYQLLIVSPLKMIARVTSGLLDQQLIDGLVESFNASVQTSAAVLKYVHRGSLRAYLGLIFIGSFLIIYFLYLI